MAQTGFTPIQLYSSSTTGNTPAAADLSNSSGGSELAINIFDGKLFYKDSSGNVQVIGWKIVPVSAGGTGQTSYTDGQLLIGNSTGNTLTKATLTAGTGITITNGSGAITINGTGGTVTSVGGTGTVNGLTLTGTVTTTGNLTLGGTLDLSAPPTIGNTTANTITGTTITANTKFAGTYYDASSSAGGNLRTLSGTACFQWGAGGGNNCTVDGSINMNGANAHIDMSPTGTGHVSINPTGVGDINNVIIGATTPLAITGTTITATTFSGSGASLTSIPNSALVNSTISGVALGGSLFNLTAGTGVSFSAGTTYNGSTAITINATGTGGTVTSVAALTLGTSGTDLSSTVANGTTTPVITLNVPTASATNRGALSAADWTTFNGKAPGVTFTSSYIPYGQGTTTLTQSAGLQFDGTNFTTTGYATATSFRPSSSTVPTNGLYLPAANTIGWATASTARMQIGATGGVSIGNTTDPGATNLSVTGIVSTTGGAFFTGGAAPAVTTTGLNVLSSQIEFIDSARTANNRMAEFIWTGGSFRGRWVNDAYSASTNWLTVLGGQAAGTTSITLTAGTGVATLASTGLAVTNSLGVGATTPSASGAGITFPATQSASTDVNTLDDYEEGTFTPNQGAGLTVVGAYTSSGTYTKVGNIVTVTTMQKGATSISATSTGVLCTNLPFTILSTTPSNAWGVISNASGLVAGIVNASGTIAYNNGTAIAATTGIYFSITYQAA
jgi:hypothetical protein